MDTFLNPRRGPGLAQNAMRFGPIIYTVLSLISPGFHFFTEMDRQMDLINMPTQNNADTFDFIIVGAGSSGSSLASRLSQHFSVLLLEAGSSPSPIHSVPTYAFIQYMDPSVDWSYRTVPQSHSCYGLINNTSVWPGGKVLGGSSLLNAMMYIRGNVQGFDEIAEKTGDDKWKLSNILKYYRELEDYHGWFDPGTHGSGGPLKVERPVFAKFTDNMMRAGQELGYAVRDPNAYGPYTEGFGKMDLYMDHGRRSDAFSEFLRPAMRGNNVNLVIRKFAHVSRVLFHENSENQAYGVEYFRHGRRYIAKAKFEVILSAGAIRSPQILMLSGIGPKEHLRQLGIPVVQNLRVGQYLQDKFGALIGPFLVDHGQAVVIERDLTVTNMLNWVTSGKGPARSTLSEGTWAVITESARRAGRTRKPNIHTYILSISMPEEITQVITRAFNIKPEVIKFFSQASKQDSFFQLVTLNAPMGKGQLYLRDTNPFTPPVLDPKYLEHDYDTMSLIEGVKMAVQIVENTTAMQEIHGRLMPGHLPGCEAYQFKSDQYYECLVRHLTLTAYKYAGTAPIGKGISDPDAVVDSNLRVLGTKNLRVVDGSVLQQRHTSINDVTCRMLGQFAADMILDDWNTTK